MWRPGCGGCARTCRSRRSSTWWTTSARGNGGGRRMRSGRTSPSTGCDDPLAVVTRVSRAPLLMMAGPPDDALPRGLTDEDHAAVLAEARAARARARGMHARSSCRCWRRLPRSGSRPWNSGNACANCATRSSGSGASVRSSTRGGGGGWDPPLAAQSPTRRMTRRSSASGIQSPPFDNGQRQREGRAGAGRGLDLHADAAPRLWSA